MVSDPVIYLGDNSAKIVPRSRHVNEPLDGNKLPQYRFPVVFLRVSLSFSPLHLVDQVVVESSEDGLDSCQQFPS